MNIVQNFEISKKCADFKNVLNKTCTLAPRMMTPPLRTRWYFPWILNCKKIEMIYDKNDEIELKRWQKMNETKIENGYLDFDTESYFECSDYHESKYPSITNSWSFVTRTPLPLNAISRWLTTSFMRAVVLKCARAAPRVVTILFYK